MLTALVSSMELSLPGLDRIVDGFRRRSRGARARAVPASYMGKFSGTLRRFTTMYILCVFRPTSTKFSRSNKIVVLDHLRSVAAKPLRRVTTSIEGSLLYRDLENRTASYRDVVNVPLATGTSKKIVPVASGTS